MPLLLFWLAVRQPRRSSTWSWRRRNRRKTRCTTFSIGHARIAAILNNAREKDIDWSQGDVSLLVDPNELALIRKMVLLPELVESMARTLEPHHLPHYALELATAFHWFYENCRVLSSNPDDYPSYLSAAEAGGGRPDRPLQDPLSHGNGSPRAHVASGTRWDGRLPQLDCLTRCP